MKTALILGVSGQDGAFLARHLLEQTYAVHGTSRDARRHGFHDGVTTHTLATTDRDALRALLAALRPDEIYNLAGVSSVARSFDDPAAAWSSIAGAQQLLLETVRDIIPTARVYHSASSECFGNSDGANEDTPFAPLSPYAEAKAEAHCITASFRRDGLFACSGLVFNHESPLRPETFVTRKIVAAAAAIAAGSTTQLVLGDTTVARDWGYAPEYVDAMWRMLQQREPRDYVLATGESHTVDELATAVFAEFGLDARAHVVSNPSLYRPSELRFSRGDASRARHELGWEARTKFSALVRVLADAYRPVPASDDATARSSSRTSSHTDQSHMYIRS